MIGKNFRYEYAELYPIMGLQAHGALGKWWIHKTYVMNTARYGIYQNHGRVICRYAYPYNPRTLIQQTPRNFFAYAISNWQAFDNNTKNFYNQIAKNRPLSGYNRYISLYLMSTPTPPVVTNFLLTEDSDIMVTEANENIELE